MSMLIAESLDTALASVAGGATPIAGGSDLVVAARHGTRALPAELVAIDRLDELKTISVDEAVLRIGAVVNHATLMTHPSIEAHATALGDAAALVGSPATRHVGTIGGNIMNASPAMDTGAPLVVLGAAVELASAERRRTLPITELWTGPGTTAAESDELCIAVHVPVGAAHGSAYVRLEYRRAMEIAVVGAAATVSLDDAGRPAALRVALSAVGPTIVDCGHVDVSGADASAIADAAAEAARAAANPISDLRASARYRLHTVGVMASRAASAALQRAQGATIAIPVNRSVGIGAAQ